MRHIVCIASLTAITRLARSVVFTQIPLAIRTHYYSTTRNIFEPSEDDNNGANLVTKKQQLPDDKP